MFVITNGSGTLFLSGRNNSYYWTSNFELAYTFETEYEAEVYEETSARDFLQYDSVEFPYIKNKSDLTLTNV